MRLFILIVGSVVLIFFSWWASIKGKRYHGVFRFFAFECILILVLQNSAIWFLDPFSPRQLISWFLLLSSITLVIHGFSLLHRFGAPSDKINAETTTNLVQHGAYAYIRHPLYSSLLLFSFGAFLKRVNGITTALILLAIIMLYLTAKVEEREVLKKFGDEYIRYMAKTRMFIPFIF